MLTVTMEAITRQYARLSRAHIVMGMVILSVVLIISWWMFIQKDEDDIWIASRGTSLETHVPEIDEKKDISKETAIPSHEFSAAPGSTGKLRSFDMSVNKNKLSGETIMANEGDTVNINITSIDQRYVVGISPYNLSQTLEKWSTKILQFQANQPGAFDLICNSCPKSPKIGKIIVKPSQQ